MSQASTRITTAKNLAQSDDRVDHQNSTGSTFNNDDSGFSEPPNPTNNSFENAKTAARNSPTQSGVGGRRLFSTDKVQNNNLIPDGTPVPRSSSTPNRVEIIIDENWDRAREDNENEPYDLNLNDSAIGFYWSDTKDENNNFNERKSGVLQPLQELDNIRLEVDLIDEKAGEAVNPRAFEKENVSNDAPEKESSYSNGDQIPQALCPHTNSETNVLFNIRDAANDAGLNDKPTLAGSKIQSELVKTDFRPLVQIKTELYDDVSDDDVPKFDDIKVKTELVDDVHSTSASDKWAKLNDISENAQLIPETCESKIPKTALDSSNVFEEISGFSNNDYVAPKRKRIGRKTLTPRRSPTKCDPKFKGATVWFQTEYKRGKSQLNISAFYSNVAVLFSDKTRQRLFGNHLLSCSPESGYTDTEENTTPPHGRETFISVKTCASCRTRRTPLWRDAEDGTPLCNACGIRYKKYRLRCSKCWHIPKKDIKTYPNCPACGASLRYVFSRRTW